MKKILFIIITLVLAMSSYAQNWTKEMQKDLRKSKDIAVVVDMSKATICDVSYDDFAVYYASKYNTGNMYVPIMIGKFENMFASYYRKEHKLPVVDEKNAKYVIHYDFHEISEEGEFCGVFYVMNGNNKSAVNTFSQKKGRWNDFESLIKENIEKFFKRNVLHDTYDPLNEACLYKYK